MKRLVLLAALFAAAEAVAQEPRAHDLGIPFEGKAGPLNAITDVAGVEVGHATIIRGSGMLVQGQGPVRTGVTAVLPRGRNSTTPVFGAWFTLNAAGEMTGTTWLEERGLIDGPITITNTHSAGVARDASIKWMVAKGWDARWHAPIAAETFDGVLSDINGFHVREDHVLAAIESARGGAVREGAVGGGTGMICHGFKGGIGTASRKLPEKLGGYTVGVLVQCNYGSRRALTIAGAPVGAELLEVDPICYARPAGGNVRRWSFPDCAEVPSSAANEPKGADGSIIVVIATDAPLLPHQLKRIAKRPSLALGRLGSVASEGSGDIFVAFSTANPGLRSVEDSLDPKTVEMLPNDMLTPFFEATIEATEEAIVNALVAAETIEGADYLKVPRIPRQEVQRILKKYKKLSDER